MNAPLLAATDLRLIPRRDECTGPWFDALAQGVLAVRSCDDCGHLARPDASGCPRCHGEALRWTPAQGLGTVVSVITDHSTAREGGGPLVLGLVELDEGPWFHVRLLDSPAIGDRVALVVLVPEQGEAVPAFRREDHAPPPVTPTGTRAQTGSSFAPAVARGQARS